jgi:uncharacterized protein YacL
MRPASNKDAVVDAAKHMGRLSKQLIFSYILDWVVIIVFAAAGGVLSIVSPRHRPFTLLNPEISFPYVEESVPIWMLGVVCLVVPAILIAIITLIFVPGAHARRTGSRAQTIRLKLWELEKGAAGLCLSLAVSFFVTQGMLRYEGCRFWDEALRIFDFSRVVKHIAKASFRHEEHVWQAETCK